MEYKIIWTVNSSLTDKEKEDGIFRYTVWSNIENIRKIKNITQKELSLKTWIRQRIISEVENWEYRVWALILEKIAEALDVSLDFLVKKNINWKLYEVYDFLIKSIGIIDILKWMKLGYLTELKWLQEKWEKVIWLIFKRYSWGPFCKDLYDLKFLFEVETEYKDNWSEVKKFKVKNGGFTKYRFLTKSDLEILENIVDNYWNIWSKELMKITYETEPMKKLKATIWGKEWWEEILI